MTDIDVERLARAIEAFSIRIGDGARVILWRGQEDQDAELIADEYDRLAPPADLDALTVSAHRYSLKEEAERKADSDTLDALAAHREQRRTRKGERR